MHVSHIISIFRALNRNKVQYVVAGGLAVVAHGYGRLTKDIDIIVHLVPENIRAAFDALKTLGYSPRVPITADQFAGASLRKSWIKTKGMKVLCMYSDRFFDVPIDIFVYEPVRFSRLYKSALIEKAARGVPVRYADTDALIFMKRKAGRPKDLDDIENLIKLKRL
jgi:hypothetical protein